MKNLYKLHLGIIMLLVSLLSCQKRDTLTIVSNTVINKQYATGVEPVNLFFSWKMQSNERKVSQSAYQVMVSNEVEFLEKNILWDSNKTMSAQSILVDYQGKNLKSGTTYFWKVKAWDNNGKESPWSDVGVFTTGLFSDKDWNGAKWIGLDSLNPENRLVPGIHNPGKAYRGKELGFHKLPILRKDFFVKKGLKQALVFVSGLGHYEMNLNGQKVGDNFMAPGWTHYDETALYNTFDVTERLKSGNNAFGLFLGNGFFIVPNSRYRKVMTAYGNPMMILQLKLVYDDGRTEWMVSDGSWKASPGPITYSSIFGGENYNATLEQEAWDSPEFDDSNWQNAIVVRAPCKTLLPEKDYPVKLLETIDTKTITKIVEIENAYLYDFGQNASGIFEISIKGNKGDSVIITPAELLHKNGQVNQNATGRSHFYTYVLKGDGIETWQPKFTYYGFRYIQIEGANPSTLLKEGFPEVVSLKMLHNRNSSPETGEFRTSYALFNQIDTLIKWAIKSNLQSVATDCPHREKLSWLEQTYLMGEGIHFNYDVYSLYSKLVDDMISAQTADGMVPDIAPEYVEFWGGFRDSPEWGSAGVILPWLIYKWYGDIEPMKKAWPMMTRYAAYLKSKSENHLIDYGLGDWYDMGPERPGFAQLTPVSLTATAIYYYDVQLLSQMAELLQKEAEGIVYKKWADEIKQAFNTEFYNAENGIYSTGSQTAISMPLVVGLVEDENREKVVQSLLNSIHESGNALTAGDVGFHFLVRALADNGQSELLYKMNARDDVPGYGYQLKKGATALTESWQALEVVSNNHLMLGHIMEWFYGGLAGIGQTKSSVGYKEIVIEPQFVGDIKSASASYECPYGLIRSSWVKREEKVDLNLTIPVNTRARIILPWSAKKGILENDHALKDKDDVISMSEEGGKLLLRIGSGQYHFSFGM